ncbi:hypothetical protein CDAR_524301 [Caerostris darwini]|uniref:Uncharacterized protein n=1 Tax=Caerostris darwini TaxID=1538125 RepID=A0AAV4S9L9_9ARAC|nr:hypothetical protein CDAR_524301 [Caerostris darwini]
MFTVVRSKINVQAKKLFVPMEVEEVTKSFAFITRDPRWSSSQAIFCIQHFGLDGFSEIFLKGMLHSKWTFDDLHTMWTSKDSL